jgi:hypothetical protein
MHAHQPDALERSCELHVKHTTLRFAGLTPARKPVAHRSTHSNRGSRIPINVTFGDKWRLFHGAIWRLVKPARGSLTALTIDESFTCIDASIRLRTGLERPLQSMYENRADAGTSALEA